MNNKIMTKQNIEEFAEKLMKAFNKNGGAAGSVFFFNNKRIDFPDNPDMNPIVTDNINPHIYVKYAAYQHILTIQFNEYMAYQQDYYCEFEKEVEEIISSYGLYYELGTSYDCSFYPMEDMEIEYTLYKEPEKPVYLYMGNMDIVPEAIKPIMNGWYQKCKEGGDTWYFDCVIGAYMEFNYNGKLYHMSQCSPYQGRNTWEPFVPWVKNELSKIGATDIVWHPGRLD